MDGQPWDTDVDPGYPQDRPKPATITTTTTTTHDV